MNMDILYEDNHLIVVNKPAGVPTQHDSSGIPCLLDQVKEYIKIRYAKPGDVFLGMVQRLDRPVSGVIVFARTSKAASRLSAQVRGRSVRKLYLGLIEGESPWEYGHWIEMTANLAREGSRTVIAGDDPSAREARLRVTNLESRDGHTFVLVDLLTGRKHQIRAQLSADGLPVAGDVKYGASPLPFGDAICLHSCLVCISHPVGGRPLSFWADPPLIITERVSWNDLMRKRVLALAGIDSDQANFPNG